MASNEETIAEQYEFEELRLMILAGAKATRCMRNPRYKYYYLACLCLLGCGCYNRTRAWPLPLNRCYNYQLLDRACRERVLKDIGHEVYCFCKQCGPPSSCGGEGSS